MLSERFEAFANLYGIFFDRVITVDGEQSSGPGGFSRTFFERSQGCTACGNCCRRLTFAKHHWFECEPHPDVPLEREEIEIAGKRLPVLVHYNSRKSEECDFLKGNLCSLHTVDTKPTHCHMSITLGVYPSRGRHWISKRLPSRNWAWPKCPIDMNATPVPGYEEKASDRLILERLNAAIGDLPGCVLPTVLTHLDSLYDMKTFFELSGGRSLLEFDRIVSPRQPSLTLLETK